MDDYKREFNDFMVRCDVLRFGDFVTKSGRRTPFFINTGNYRTGSQLSRLGGFYARAIRERLGERFEVLFGPAYKGIPRVVATAMRLLQDFGHDVAVAFNRKESKDHGEGGALIGHRPRDGDRFVIVEDVTTAGTSIRETLPLLRNAARVQLAGLVVSVDRMERGQGAENALPEVGREFGMPTFAIVTIEEIVAHLAEHPVDGRRVLDAPLLERVREYRATYGGPRP